MPKKVCLFTMLTPMLKAMSSFTPSGWQILQIVSNPVALFEESDLDTNLTR